MMQNRCEQADRKLNLASSWWRSLDPGAGSCSKDEDLAHTRAVVHNSPGYPHERSYASDPEWAVPVRKPFAPTPSAGPAGASIIHTQGVPRYQDYGTNTDWWLFAAGWLCIITWFVGALLPLCRRPRFPGRRNKAGWVANTTGSVVGIALFIAVIVVAVKKHDDCNGGTYTAGSWPYQYTYWSCDD